MAEYIERAPLINELNDIREMYRAAKNFNAVSAVDNAIGEVKDAPAADVRPERYGRWARPPRNTTKCSYLWQCSECNEIAYWVFNGGKLNRVKPIGYKYCPNCGAKMDGKERGIK